MPIQSLIAAGSDQALCFLCNANDCHFKAASVRNTGEML